MTTQTGPGPTETTKAKGPTETTDAEIKTGELVQHEAAGMLEARPDFIEKGNFGTENIGKDDLLMPRLAMAQKSSPEIEEDNAKFIAGLKFGDLFNSVTRELYGKSVQVVVLRVDPPKFIEFKPMSEGGGVVDMNVPADDPRTKFTTNAKGERVPPVATMFREYVGMLLPTRELIGLSFKGTSLAAAKQLNSLIRFRNAPIYAGIFQLSTEKKTNDKGTFAVFTVKNAGWIRDADLYAYAKGMSEGLAGKVITIQQDPNDDPDTFDPAAMEQQGSGAPAM